jgi:hypothetical protein
MLSRLSDATRDIIPFRRRHFTTREAYRENYRQLAAALVSTLEFRTHLDLGCAQGLLLEPLVVDHGRDSRGVELGREVEPLLPPVLRDRVTFADVTTIEPPAVDLVTCIEVAEHIPHERSASLVDVIARASQRWVYFTAAIPRQPGHGHINLQPNFFWIDLFDRRGFDLHVDRTRALIAAIADMRPCYWLPQNSLVFARR